MNDLANNLSEIHATLNTLTSSPHSHDVVELALATATSLPLGGREHPAPVWLLIAGVPSSGKTEAVLLLKRAANIMYLDSMTENSFASGYVDDKTGAGSKDLLPQLDGKCLIIKDLTTLFSMNEDKVKKILGDFQSIYDGEYTKATGTRGVIRYDSVFSMIACITPVALHKHHNFMSTIGGRFLVIRLLPLTDLERKEGFDRAWNEEARQRNLPKLRALLLEHVENVLTSPLLMETETTEQQDILNQLANLLARGRGVVITERVNTLNEHTGVDRYSYEIAGVQIEEPYRALAQLRTLGRALARVHGRSRITGHEIELLRRVVLSSILPGRGQALAYFRAVPAGLTAKGLAGHLNQSDTQARTVLKDLAALSLVIEDKSAAVHVYRPIPDLAGLIAQEVGALPHEVDLLGETANQQNSPHTNIPTLTEEMLAPVGSLV